MPDKKIIGDTAIDRMVGNAITHGGSNEKEASEAIDWKKKAEESRHKREYIEEERMMEHLGEREPPEPPFKVTGSVDLGNINIQEQQHQIMEDRERERKRYEEREKALNEELNKTKEALRDTQTAQALEKISAQFNTTMREMNSKIEAVKGGGDPNQLISSFNVLTSLVNKMGELGFTRNQQIGDPQIQLEITKLNMENARAEREFKLRMEQSNREWELEKIKFAETREVNLAKLQQEKDRDSMFAAFPQVLGSAIAQGLIANNEKGGQSIGQKSEQPASEGRAGVIEIGMGEYGEVQCSQCKEIVAVGPTSTKAICAKCGAQYGVKRVQVMPQESEMEEEIHEGEVT